MASFEKSSTDIFHPGGRLRMDLLHSSTATVLRETLGYTRATNWNSVRTPHLFMGLLAVPDDSVRSWGRRLKTDLPRLLEQFCELFYQDEGDPDAVLFLNREFLSDNVIRILRQAHYRAISHNRTLMMPIDLLIGLFTTPNSIVAECFEKNGLSVAKLTELAVMAELAPREG